MTKGIPAIILAAGESSRLGQPKALVQWNDESLVSRSVPVSYTHLTLPTKA